jgi:hypothetical protein
MRIKCLIFLMLLGSMVFSQSYPSSIHHCSTPASNDGSIDLSNYDPSIIYTYHWSTGDTIQDLAGLAPGIYAVSISSETACTQFIHFNIKDCSILDETDYLNLSFSYITSGDPENNTGQIELLPVNGSAHYYYKWSGPSGELIAGKMATGLHTGLYCVTVTDACSEYSDCIDLQSNFSELAQRKLKVPFKGFGVQDELINTYQFYPNPFSDQLQLNANILNEGYGSIVIRDGLGRELYKKDLYWQSGLNQFAFDLPMIKNAGLYFTECYLNHQMENRTKIGKH